MSHGSQNIKKPNKERAEFEEEDKEPTLSGWDLASLARRRSEREKDLKIREHRRRKQKDRQAA